MRNLQYKRHLHAMLILLFGLSAAHGQRKDNSGIVHYELIPVTGGLFDNEARQNPRLPMIFEQLTFSLIFNDSQSAFSLNENKQLDRADLKDAGIFFIGVSTDKYFWQDVDAAYHAMNATPFIDGDYLLVDSFKNGWHSGWEITGETKKIDGYTCVKATRDDLGWDIEGNERRFPVVAWFCPELPFAFGPMKYGGLPGLILELQTHMTLFAAKSITLGGDFDIPPIADFERMTEKAFYKQIDEQIRERRKSRRTALSEPMR